MRNLNIVNFVSAYLQQFSEAESISLENIAQYLFRQVAAALLYLHDRVNVIHRDVKPDNILFSSRTAEIKLTDFTVSRGDLAADTRLYDSEGTPCFTAPECHIIEKDGYEPRPTDIWSFGVCLYTFCSDGRLPFYGSSEIEIQIKAR